MILKGIAQPVALAEIVRTPAGAPAPVRIAGKKTRTRRWWAAGAILPFAGLLAFVPSGSRDQGRPARRGEIHAPRRDHAVRLVNTGNRSERDLRLARSAGESRAAGRALDPRELHVAIPRGTSQRTNR